MPAAFILVMVVMLLGALFLSLAVSMRRQRASPGGGGRRLSDDSFARLDAALEDEAVPEAISDDEVTDRLRGLERWTDDGGTRTPVELP
jgi:hypothetical protein